MAKVKAKSVIVPSVVLTVICIVIAASLAFTNSITADKIAALEKQQSVEAMKAVFDDEGASFRDGTVTLDDKEYSYSAVTLNGETIGYVFTVSNNGYGGAVKVMTGINNDGTVRRIQVLSVDDETPGLGQNAKSKAGFSEQFSGKSGSISYEKNKDIDALTGATITTNAVVRDVNTALELFQKVKGE